MKGQAITYSAEELAWVEAHKTLVRRIAHAKFGAKFNRADVSLGAYNSLCKRNGWMTGRTGHYAPGEIPQNKGKKMPYNAGSAKTQFKKGGPPHNIRYLGHERLSKDGYVEISVAETNPHTGYWRRYVSKHRLLWEQANGPLPDGFCLKSLDGDKTNTDPANWKAVPRAMLPRLNGRFGRNYDAAPAEIKPTIMAITTLEHSARTIKKGTRK